MNQLENLRKEIDEIDKELLDLFLKRMSCIHKVADYKRANNIPILDKNREQEILDRVTSRVEPKEKEFVKNFFSCMMEISRLAQANVPMKNIILIGMPGCGKTTIGKSLSNRLGMEFCDTDIIFESKHEIKISDFFKSYGEPTFRIEESKILSELSEKRNTIISTGGGVVETECNKELLQKSGIVVFINRSPEDIFGDIETSHRPLLADGRNKIFELFEKRLDKYKDFCHIEIKNNDSIDSITEKIINEVNHYNG